MTVMQTVIKASSFQILPLDGANEYGLGEAWNKYKYFQS